MGALPDQAELLDFEALERFVDCVDSIEAVVTQAVLDARSDVRADLQRVDQAIDEAQASLAEIEGDCQSSDEEDALISRLRYAAAKNRVARIESAAEHVYSAARRYFEAAEDLSGARDGLFARASRYLADKRDSVDAYLRCQPDGDMPVHSELPILLEPINAAIEVGIDVGDAVGEVGLESIGAAMDVGLEAIDAVFGIILGGGDMPPEIFVDPEKIREFASTFLGMIADCRELLSSVDSELGGLRRTWRDQDFDTFSEAFQTSRDELIRFRTLGEVICGRLIESAERAEKYRAL